MQKNTKLYAAENARGSIKAVQAQNGGTKGHSKPGTTGGTHAGPPPAPQPQSTKK